MKSKSTERKLRKKHTAQFKEQAILRATKDGVPKVAQDLGIAPSMLYSWRAKPGQSGQSFEAVTLQQSQLARLKRENARLEDENAFLKKAAAYFAKQPK